MEITFTWRSKCHKARSCDGKVKYGHQHTASVAALRMSAKTGAAFDVYECVYCQRWHIGHSIYEEIAG